MLRLISKYASARYATVAAQGAAAMNPQPAITSAVSAAALIADPSRAAMLLMLVDGRAHPAGELAYSPGYRPRPRAPIWPSSSPAVS